MSISIKNIILVLIFLLLQVVWFNHMLVFGKFSPIIYIFPLLQLPLKKNENLSIIIAFIMGLIIDIFVNTGGVFTATALFIVYLRKAFFLLIKSKSQDIEDISPEKISFSTKIIYYISFIFLSQLLIYTFESFNLMLVFHKLPLLLINTLVSLILFLFIDYIFINKTRTE